MTLKTLIAGHVAGTFLRLDHFADEVVCRPPGGPDVTLRGVLGDVRTTEVQLPSGQWIKQRVRTLAIGRDPAAACGGIASPQLKMTVIVGAEAWAVQEIESEDETMVTLQLVFKGLMESPARFVG